GPGPIEWVGLDHEELLLLIERLHGVFLFFRSFDPNRKTTPRITQEFVTRPPTRSALVPVALTPGGPAFEHPGVGPGKPAGALPGPQADQRLAMSSSACLTRSAPIFSAHSLYTPAVAVRKASRSASDRRTTDTPFASISLSSASSPAEMPARARAISSVAACCAASDTALRSASDHEFHT